MRCVDGTVILHAYCSFSAWRVAPFACGCYGTLPRWVRVGGGPALLRERRDSTLLRTIVPRAFSTGCFLLQPPPVTHLPSWPSPRALRLRRQPSCFSVSTNSLCHQFLLLCGRRAWRPSHYRLSTVTLADAFVCSPGMAFVALRAFCSSAYTIHHTAAYAERVSVRERCHGLWFIWRALVRVFSSVALPTTTLLLFTYRTILLHTLLAFSAERAFLRRHRCVVTRFIASFSLFYAVQRLLPTVPLLLCGHFVGGLFGWVSVCCILRFFCYTLL